MDNALYSLLVIMVAALVTVLLRFLPFIIFSGKRSAPDFIQYLGTVLPYSIMAMLVVYCLKDISFITLPELLSSIISVVIVIFFHLWKRNTLLSIAGGTACYMILIRILG